MSGMVKAFTFGELVNSHLFSYSEICSPFKLDGRDFFFFFFYDHLFLCISLGFKYSTQVTLPVTKCFLNYPSVTGPVHRHRGPGPLKPVLAAPPTTFWALVLLAWTPPGWSMLLKSESVLLFSALLSGADFLL